MLKNSSALTAAAWRTASTSRRADIVWMRATPQGAALYSSMGFVEDGRRENAVKLRDGRYRDLVHMYRYTTVATRALQRAP